MKRLSSEQIDNILQDYSKGEKVAFIAQKYEVANMVVYYHIKTKGCFFIAKPKCYQDYVRREIYRLQKELKTATGERRKGIQEVLSIHKNALNINTRQCSPDPFVIQ